MAPEQNPDSRNWIFVFGWLPALVRTSNEFKELGPCPSLWWRNLRLGSSEIGTFAHKPDSSDRNTLHITRISFAKHITPTHCTWGTCCLREREVKKEFLVGFNRREAGSEAGFCFYHCWRLFWGWQRGKWLLTQFQQRVAPAWLHPFAYICQHSRVAAQKRTGHK